MNTNKVNAQNPAFFADLHAAFDRLEAKFGDCAVVLTGTGAVFSAGLDLDHHFALFARRSLKEIDASFDAYRATNLRLFTYPRPTVAAINGRAYAGGLITALDCDHRIASEGGPPIRVERGANRHPHTGGLLRDHQARDRSARRARAGRCSVKCMISRPPRRWAWLARSLRQADCSMTRWPGPRLCRPTAIRLTRSRSARCRRRRSPLSTPPRGLIVTGCLVACPNLRASAPTHAGIAS